jgi:hypothetical protein
MSSWEAGFMLSNGRPLLVLVRKVAIKLFWLRAGRHPFLTTSDVAAALHHHRPYTGGKSRFSVV